MCGGIRGFARHRTGATRQFVYRLHRQAFQHHPEHQKLVSRISSHFCWATPGGSPTTRCPGCPVTRFTREMLARASQRRNISHITGLSPSALKPGYGSVLAPQRVPGLDDGIETACLNRSSTRQQRLGAKVKHHPSDQPVRDDQLMVQRGPASRRRHAYMLIVEMAMNTGAVVLPGPYADCYPVIGSGRTPSELDTVDDDLPGALSIDRHPVIPPCHRLTCEA